MKLIVRLGMQRLWRDWRGGELHLLLLAMVLAVGAVASVALFADRLERSLTREAAQVLGGDLLLVSDQPWPEPVRREAHAAGLQTAQSWSFTSMAFAGDHAELAGVKAVEDGYPLRGQLRTAPGLNRPDQASKAPPPGSVFVDERLASRLALAPGQRLQLGDASLQVAAVLTFESDRGASFFAFVPRLMMNAADLPATGLIQEGSRVRYRLAVAGPAEAVDAFRRSIAPRLERGQHLESIENAQPEVRGALEKAARFLRLAAMLAVVLAAVAIGLAVRRYVERNLDGCAVLRCLGAKSGTVLGLLLAEFMTFGLLASAAGVALGFAVQALLARMLAGLLPATLPAAGWQPVALALAVGLTLLIGFVLPQLMRMRSVSTLRVLRREWRGADAALAYWLFGAASLAVLMFALAGEWRLGATVLGGFAAATLIYGALAGLGLALLGRLPRGGGAGWRLGLVHLKKRGATSVVQIVSLALGLTALLILTVSRGELLDAWRARVPDDAPNRFIINVQQDQVDPVHEYFRSAGLPPPLLQPMVRGRLVTRNGTPVGPDDYQVDRARRLVEREFNLSWAAQLPEGNRVAAGRWSGEGWSVEEGLAKTLGLALGDRLAFEVGGRRIEAPVTSLRRLEWDSMRVNFFVIAPPSLLSEFPASYISSFHLAPAAAPLVDRLVRDFPNVTVIDVEAVLRQFQQLLEQLAGGVQLVFGFALLAGVTVLWAAIASTHDERAFELAVLRTLGARRPQLRAALAAEFGALGILSGTVAALGAVAITAALARWVLELDYVPNLPALALVVAASLLGVLLAGLQGTRRLLRLEVMTAIRGV